MSTFLVLAWLAAVDGGVPAKPQPPRLSDDEAEMLRHLEVLEAMDEVKDLELLEELSVER